MSNTTFNEAKLAMAIRNAPIGIVWIIGVTAFSVILTGLIYGAQWVWSNLPTIFANMR